MSGSGTFENYNSVGVGCAATPDGRLSGQPVASDCSAQPYLQVSDYDMRHDIHTRYPCQWCCIQCMPHKLCSHPYRC